MGAISGSEGWEAKAATTSTPSSSSVTCAAMAFPASSASFDERDLRCARISARMRAFASSISTSSPMASDPCGVHMVPLCPSARVYATVTGGLAQTYHDMRMGADGRCAGEQFGELEAGLQREAQSMSEISKIV